MLVGAFERPGEGPEGSPSEGAPEAVGGTIPPGSAARRPFFTPPATALPPARI